jgi:hypothetical protein
MVLVSWAFPADGGVAPSGETAGRGLEAAPPALEKEVGKFKKITDPPDQGNFLLSCGPDRSVPPPSGKMGLCSRRGYGRSILVWRNYISSDFIDFIEKTCRRRRRRHVSNISRHFNFKPEGGVGFMKTLIGGAVAAVLGLIGLSVWFGEFLQILAGALPIMLLLGGGLALYLGFDELKDTWKKEEPVEPAAADEGDDVEKYKKEIEDLKKEIETLKGEKA